MPKTARSAGLATSITERASDGNPPMTRHVSFFFASALTLALALAALPSTAHAGGFYLLDRGTRAMGRGGAFVAGADDPQSLWYNPAGIAFSGNQFMLDATMTVFGVDYTRVDSGGATLPTVHGNSAPLPIPTLAGTFNLGLRNFTFGVGLFAPNAALMQYPSSVNVGGMQQPAPQRYSLLSMDGSIIASLALGVAWRPIDELSIGIGVHVVYGSFAARTTMSACDGVTCAFPEDPDYDAVAQLTLNPAFTAIATIGATYDAGPVRFGLSVMTPYALSGTSQIQVRVPSSATFNGAFVRTREGSCAGVTDQEIQSSIAAGGTHPCQSTRADLNLDFPWVIRFGVQLEAIENFNLEASVVWETWSLEQQVSVGPRNVWFAQALGGALDYQVGPLSIPRHMRDTVSVRIGGEYTIDNWVQIRAGGYFETGAFDDAWLQALTIDSDKLVVSAGVSMRVDGGLWLDALVGYAHLFPHNVTNSQVPQPNPIRPPLSPSDPRMPGDPTFVGNGSYNMTAPFFGVGLRWITDYQAPQSAASDASVLDAETTTDSAVGTSVEVLPADPEPVVEDPVPPAQEVSPLETPEPAAEPDDAPARPRGRGRTTRRRRPR
jgi:long-chain fatty acid transport protein